MNGEGRQQGAASVYFLFFSLALFGLLVMATDFGRLYLIQGELQAAADAAALAAAKELAGTVNARLHSEEQLTATFDITTGNDNRYNLRINEIGTAGGSGLQTLVQTDYFATLLDAKQNINGGQSGGIDWGSGIYPKYVRVQITAQAQTVFVPALSRALSAFPEVTVTAIAGISTPICTACGIDGLAVVDQSAGTDPLNYGFIPGSFYTLYLTPTQQASRPPGTLAGTITTVPYVLLNHIPAGPPNLGLDHQLFALAAGGLSTAAGLEPAGTVTASVPDLAFPDLLNNPGLAAPVSQSVLCGLNERFGVDPTENICSTIAGGELVALGAYFGADTDAGAEEEYVFGDGLQDYATEYDGNRRRVLTMAVIEAADPVQVNVLNFRQFLIVKTPGATVGLIPNQPAGAFRAQYIGAPVPLRCGNIGGPCEITSGVGRTVLY